MNSKTEQKNAGENASIRKLKNKQCQSLGLCGGIKRKRSRTMQEKGLLDGLASMSSVWRVVVVDGKDATHSGIDWTSASGSVYGHHEKGVHAMLSIEDLPKDLQPFAEIGGVEKAAKYALRVGGYPVNLRHYDGTAKTTNEDMREIIRHFGAANASKIFATLGSGQVLIPNCVGVIRKRRNDNIVTMRKNGAKINDIALTHKLTTRTVFTILAGRRAKQADKPKLGGIKRTTSKMRRKSIIS